MNNFKPYLIRALYEWCNDNLLTPYIRVYVNEFTQVPKQYVVEEKIVLNIGSTASKDLIIDNNFVSFYARFSGIEQKILIPVGHIISFYAKENGQGMNFEVEIYTSKNAKNNNDNNLKNYSNDSDKNKKVNHLKIVKNNLL